MLRTISKTNKFFFYCLYNIYIELYKFISLVNRELWEERGKKMLNGLNNTKLAFNGQIQARYGNAACHSQDTTFQEDQQMVESLKYKVNQSIRLNDSGQVVMKNNMVVTNENDCLVVSRKDKETGKEIIWRINPNVYRPAVDSDKTHNKLYQAVVDMIETVKQKAEKLANPENSNLDFEKRMFLSDLDRL